MHEEEHWLNGAFNGLKSRCFPTLIDPFFATLSSSSGAMAMINYMRSLTLNAELKESNMKLRSSYPGKLFWRVFNSDDSFFIVGLKEGVLKKGDSVEFNHPSGTFQMELKKDNLGGHILYAAGTHVFSNGDQLIMLSNGQLGGINIVGPGHPMPKQEPGVQPLEPVHEIDDWPDLRTFALYVTTPGGGGGGGSGSNLMGVHFLED